MDQNFIIWSSIVTGVIILVGIHVWLHKLIKFKMDESAIVKHLKSSMVQSQFIKAYDVADKVDISVDRVSEVIRQSKLMVSESSNEGDVLLKLI